MNPYQHCPICGVKMNASGHRCSEKVLRGIEAANTRAENEDDLPSDRREFWRTQAQRLNEGLRMMESEEDQ